MKLVVVDADVLEAVTADRVRDQGPAGRTRYPWALDNHGLAPGRTPAETGHGAHRVRCRWQERFSDPPHHRTLRHPACAKRDRVTERDDRGIDATTPDHRGHACLDRNPDHGRAPQLAHDHTGEVG